MLATKIVGNEDAKLDHIINGGIQISIKKASYIVLFAGPPGSAKEYISKRR